VLTKVELGEADAGLVYRTDVLAAGGKVETVPSPEAEAAVTEYPIAALSGSKSAAARGFVDWVLDKGEPVLEKAGFAAP
jgi:molybdate transport system substrate-binding protein